jgi:hypothetical protein
VANAFSEYLPHFAVKALGGIDFRSGIKPLGGILDPPADGPAEAEARGRREARVEAEAEFAETRAADLAAYEQRLADKEREFAEATADAIADRLVAGLAEIEEHLAGHVADALSRFLDTAIRNRAVGELAETVSALLASGVGTRVRVAGPEQLISRLRQRLVTRGESIAYAANEAADVTVALDDTIVETRIGAWIERLKVATGEMNG